MRLKNKKVLIIGSTGFIGYHLAKKLSELNFKVYSLSKNKPSKNRKLLKVKYLLGDISKLLILKKLLKKRRFDYVVNLGGHIDHNNKIKTRNSHYFGTKNLASIFLHKKIKKFIQIGSSSEYGNVSSPQFEYFKCNPKMIYGLSKLKATNFLLNLNKKFNFPVTILRLYQVYGPNQKINRFIPLLINACIKNIKFPTSHGKQQRDFLYVDDVVSAILKTLNSKLSHGKIINIGSGKPVKLLKIMNLVKKIIGQGEMLLDRIKLRTDEPILIYPNLYRARTILKWRSKISLEKGILKTIKFYIRRKKIK